MRIDGVFTGQNAVLTGIGDILGRLNVGDMVRAQILEITSSELLLRLFDGTTFKASSMIPVEAARGDFVDFLVKGRENSQLLLETVKGVPDKTEGDENELKKQLLAQGLKVNEPNMELARQIKSRQLPLTQETLEGLAALVAKFKDLSPEKAAFLTGNRLPVEPRTIQQLNAFINEKNHITRTLQDIVNLLELPEQGLSQHAGRQEDKGNGTPLQKPGMQEISPEETMAAEKSERPTDLLAADIQKELRAMLQKSGLTNPDEKLVRQLADRMSGSVLNHEQLTAESGKLSEEISIELQKHQEVALKNTGSLTDAIRLVVDRKIQELEKMNLRDEKALSGNAVETMKKELETLFKRIDSPELSKDIQINELHRELTGKLEVLREVIHQNAHPMRENLLQKLDSLDAGLKFITELNQHTLYYPIPLQIGSRHTGGELYVLKRNPGKRKLDPENVTMLLSLDMENIGQVDSLVSLKKKNVTLNLRVQDEGLFELIRENHKQLYQRLAELGYKLVDLKYRLMEEPADMINVNELVRKEMKDTTRRIDYRL